MSLVLLKPVTSQSCNGLSNPVCSSWDDQLCLPVPVSLISAHTEPGEHIPSLRLPTDSNWRKVPDCSCLALGCLLQGMSSGEQEAPPSSCVLCINDEESRQSLNSPLLSFSMEFDSTMSKAVTLPHLHGVRSARQPVIMCVILCCWCKSLANY